VKSIAGELKIEQRIDYSEFLEVDDAFGTTDAVIIDDENLTVHIIDFKYGKGKVEAEGNTQLFLYGVPFLPYKLKLHIVQPRIDWVDVWEPSDDKILDYIDVLRDAAKKVEKVLNGVPEYHVGEQCVWCPAKAMCRAYYDEVLSEFDVVEPDTLSVDELTKIKNKSTAIRNYLDVVDKYLFTLANTGVDVPGWRIGEGRFGNRRWVGNLETVIGDKAYKQELRSVTEIERMLPRKSNNELWEELDRMIERPPGKRVLVPDDPTSEFENME
jgi:hypothetical protein